MKKKTKIIIGIVIAFIIVIVILAASGNSAVGDFITKLGG